jgi:parallel beta-helix repeat protein
MLDTAGETRAGVLLGNLVCEGDADAIEDSDAAKDSSKDALHGIMVHEGAEVRLVGCTVSRASGCGLVGRVQGVPEKSKIPIKPCTVSICNSDFRANKHTGVWLVYARNCSLIKSRFTGNGHNGLYLDGTPGIRIEGCTVSSNREHGIALDRPFTHLKKGPFINDIHIKMIGL